jgi:STE24 endopeptidase
VLLLPTAVPNDLSLAHVDVKEVFGAALVARAQRYEHFVLVDWLLASVTLLIVLSLYAKRGAVFVRESAAGPIGTGMLLGMLGLGIVWLAQLPFQLASHWWERRHGLSSVGYLTWLVDDWGLLAGEFLAVCLALLIVMALARRLGERWWLPGAVAFVAIAALFTFVSPYLSFGEKPLRSEALLAAARVDERKLGLSHVPVRIEKVSDSTPEANAAAVGIGPSRRVVLWDTLLRPPFSLHEQEVALAHELAHHARDHLLKGLGWFALFAFPAAWILMRTARRRGGMGEPEAVPLALLVMAVLQLATLPAQNWISRRIEAEADWKALQVTRNPASLQKLMVGFSKTSLGDPSPPTWAYVLLWTHPTFEQRIAMAKAWAERRSG